MSLTHPPRYQGPPPPPNQNYSYPPRIVEAQIQRESQPILPPMSSLLPREERLERAPLHNSSYPPEPPQSFPPQEPKHPLWLAERDPAAPVQHIFHGPYPPPAVHSPHPRQDPVLVPSPATQIPREYVPQHPQGRQSPQRQHRKISQRPSELPKAGTDRIEKEPARPHNSFPMQQQPYQHQNIQAPQHHQPLHPIQAPRAHSIPQLQPPPPPRPQQSYQPAVTQAPPPPPQGLSSNSMQISGLLSSSPAPTNHGPSQPQRSTPRHSIRMRQQPVAARACGFGERDRRVIDPPPILQMVVEDPNASQEAIKAMIRHPCTVVHCTLWDPVADKDDTAMPGTTDKRQQRRLMGTLVSSPFVGKDEHGVEGCFFTFPDLSVRTPGKYSLRFSLMILDPARMAHGNSVPVSSVVFSDAFNVFNAKDFGGMRPSTELTKRLKHQGCLISVKKGNAKTGGGLRDDDDDEDDEEEEADMDEKKAKRPSKRIKR
ncbi:hypothetical protein GLAREA_01755 [Glarea lozoyensis ATCC 20868]|uniref:Velvet domain-containing protein n=1 Tax=Glarea lozoyensis (strain ATCC 20868 / MF5171) TaxID=1116229 RepID=S3DGZ3_GLAL2|nr:uncharacterized protein GLAREA_01755 [Glarea lozoyensis ATCC 20868]EPE25843.1 hypothetical protein GLAREA_01755 [Glarea lozoyensis ATCC 20868]